MMYGSEQTEVGYKQEISYQIQTWSHPGYEIAKFGLLQFIRLGYVEDTAAFIV